MSLLADRRFVVIAGKGGVGRTTMAAALALALARQGKRVLLAQTRAKQRVDRLVGGPPVGQKLVRSAPNLWCVNMTPEAALHEYGLMVLRFEAVYHAVFENRFVHAFLRAVPGLDDYSMLGKAWHHTREKAGVESNGKHRFDTVILDGPATGHLIPMLRLPKVILETAPPGPLVRDATHMWRLLQDPAQTAIHLVTLAEEMPVSETIDLQRLIRDDLGLPLGALVVNAVLPDLIEEHSPTAKFLDRVQPAHDSNLRMVCLRASLLRRRRRMQEQAIGKLSSEVFLPKVFLPKLFVPELGLAEIGELAQSITSSVSPVSTA